MFRFLSILLLLQSTCAVMPNANYTFQSVSTTTESIIVVPVVISAAVAVGFTLILSLVLYRYYNKKVPANDHNYHTVYNM
jgi:uncharacterized membrane protein YdbT with pleckstrin-like domain